VNHKKTFFFIEQLILKHKMHQNCVNIKERIDGLDFFFNTRSHAVKFYEFVSEVVPIKVTQAKQLISHDEKSNTFVYKFTFSGMFLFLKKS
jgi:nonsense-mediated mRNA decay protein 3